MALKLRTARHRRHQNGTAAVASDFGKVGRKTLSTWPAMIVPFASMQTAGQESATDQRTDMGAVHVLNGERI